jgi:hypothetical protein
LRAALYWAACNLGDIQAFIRFSKECEQANTLRVLNRGYLLYYQGDIDRKQPPPYADDDKRVGWHKTRQGTLEMFRAQSYIEHPFSRIAIDIFTYLDLASFRGEKLSLSEKELFSNLVGTDYPKEEGQALESAKMILTLMLDAG